MLNRLDSTPVDDLTRQRLKHNEAVFRTVNDEIDELGEGGSRSSRAFVCECADPNCSETIQLTHAEYARIRSEPRHYILVPGHEIPEIEDVVEQAPDHIVVEKD
jgi:hypothetical protein